MEFKTTFIRINPPIFVYDPRFLPYSMISIKIHHFIIENAVVVRLPIICEYFARTRQTRSRTEQPRSRSRSVVILHRRKLSRAVSLIAYCRHISTWEPAATLIAQCHDGACSPIAGAPHIIMSHSFANVGGVDGWLGAQHVLRGDRARCMICAACSNVYLSLDLCAGRR